jgi:hypothetical protein
MKKVPDDTKAVYKFGAYAFALFGFVAMLLFGGIAFLMTKDKTIRMTAVGVPFLITLSLVVRMWLLSK